MVVRQLTATIGAAALVLVSMSGTADATTLETCNGLEATIVGTAWDETIYGTDGDDVIVGVAGQDSIYGGEGNDTICGGNTDSTYLQGQGGNDVLILLAGGWTDGGDGDDTIDTSAAGGNLTFYSATGPVEVDLARGTSTGPGVGTDQLIGVDSVFGTAWGDRIVGSDRTESFQPAGGDDLVLAGGGNDVIQSDFGGADRLVGQDGVDQIYSDGIRDVYRGGSGSDILSERGELGRGNPRMYGGRGNDVLVAHIGPDASDYANGGAGTDRCEDFVNRENCELS